MNLLEGVTRGQNIRTGPVKVLFDLVDHVPTSWGSNICAKTENVDKNMTKSNSAMEYGNVCL
jgi:hypothetical protein